MEHSLRRRHRRVERMGVRPAGRGDSGVAGRAGAEPRGRRTCDARGLDRVNRLRLVLNVPYLALAVGFLGWAVVQSFSTGGTADVPPGVGPGCGSVWRAPCWPPSPSSRRGGAGHCAVRIGSVPDHRLHRAGADGGGGTGQSLLAHPFCGAEHRRRRHRSPEPRGGRRRGALRRRRSAAGDRHRALDRLIECRGPPGDHAAGSDGGGGRVFVWVLPVGRDLDAFHGIAQSASTVGVGFEAYLAWTAAAAIIGGGVVLAATSAGERHCGGQPLESAWCSSPCGAAAQRSCGSPT